MPQTPSVATPQFVSQNVSATAVGVSGMSAFFLDSNGLDIMWVTVETVALRWRDDGTSPTSSVGHILPTSTNPPLCISGKQRMRDFKMISSGAAGIVSITLDNRARLGGTV